MTIEAKKYCAMAIIQYLNGNVEQFERAREKAVRHFELENSGFKIGDIIPTGIREKLYTVVG